MHFQHAPEIWSDFPELAAGVLAVDGITADVTVNERVAAYQRVADDRLGSGTESDLPEIQAWRRTFSKMGLKPTQYRCAAEALLRRYRKDRSLPEIHPLIDLCNAVSLAFATPIAVFDVSRIKGSLEVRYATGDESYLTFSGETEHPEPGEVIFVDIEKQAHARRWTNRQSGLSAMRKETSSALIVAEALHESADRDLERLTATLAGELKTLWRANVTTGILSEGKPRFEFNSLPSLE